MTDAIFWWTGAIWWITAGPIGIVLFTIVAFDWAWVQIIERTLIRKEFFAFVNQRFKEKRAQWKKDFGA